MSLIRVNEHTFFGRFINKDSIVLDLGANQGKFSLAMIERFGCNLFAIEANPDLLKQIPPHPLLKKLNLAISKTAGSLNFHIDENSECSSLFLKDNQLTTKTVKVAGLPLEDLVESLGVRQINLVKMDIEGAEIEVLDSCSDSFLQSIHQLSIEFHDFNGLVSHEEVSRTLNRLQDLGFFVLSMAKNSHFDVCLINHHHCRISLLEYGWASLVLKNAYGLNRILQRLFKPSTP
jgi:FkbM family methyltransferase